MEVKATVRRSVVLLTGILITYLLAQATALEWLSWVAILLSGLLFMTFYWLGICCLALWSEREEMVPVKAPEPPVFDEPAPLFESIVSPELSTGQIVPE